MAKWINEFDEKYLTNPKSPLVYLTGDQKRYIVKIVEAERKAFITGRRCLHCGNPKEVNLADMCGECFEEA